jgi:preprotein translocase SecE subunit
MARQNRQERRARRAQQQPALAGGPPPRPQPAPTPAAQSDESRRPRRAQAPEQRHVPGSGTVRFVEESIGELKKVEWPSQRAVVSGTAVVLMACVIVGTYLWLNDQLWKYVVQHLLLR